MKKLKALDDNFSMQETIELFNESYEMLRLTNESFCQKMQKIYDKNNVTLTKFLDRTCLGRHFYDDFITPKYIPKMRSFISMCMGLNLDLPTAESLLESLSLRFDRTDKVDCAYMYLLTHHQGLNIEDCNKILKGLGIDKANDLLGTIPHDER